MKLKEKIKQRMDGIQEMMESGNRENIEEKIANVSKFWRVLSEEDRDYINAVRFAVENKRPWSVL